MNIEIYGTRGGIGTTTVAVGLGAVLADLSHNVIVTDHIGNDGLVPIMGHASPQVKEFDGEPECDIKDFGTKPIADKQTVGEPEFKILVVKSDYVNIATGVKYYFPTDRWDGFVVVEHEQSALKADDVVRLLQLNPERTVRVPYDPAIQRAVDAGVFSRRLPTSIREPLMTIVNWLGQ